MADLIDQAFERLVDCEVLAAKIDILAERFSRENKSFSADRCSAAFVEVRNASARLRDIVKTGGK